MFLRNLEVCCGSEWMMLCWNLRRPATVAWIFQTHTFSRLSTAKVKCSVKIGSPWVWDDEWQECSKRWPVIMQLSLQEKHDIWAYALPWFCLDICARWFTQDYVEKTPDVTAVGSLVEVKDPKALRARPWLVNHTFISPYLHIYLYLYLSISLFLYFILFLYLSIYLCESMNLSYLSI